MIDVVVLCFYSGS